MFPVGGSSERKGWGGSCVDLKQKDCNMPFSYSEPFFYNERERRNYGIQREMLSKMVTLRWSS